MVPNTQLEGDGGTPPPSTSATDLLDFESDSDEQGEDEDEIEDEEEDGEEGGGEGSE